MPNPTNRGIALKLRNIACQFEDDDFDNAIMVLDKMVKDLWREVEQKAEALIYDYDGPR